MQVEVHNKIGTRGEIQCSVVHKDGSVTEYPIELNTHTYTWFKEINYSWSVGSNSPMALSSFNRIAVGGGTTPITKESTKLQASIASGDSTAAYLGRVPIGGVDYFAYEFTFGFPIGSIVADIKEVGMYKDATLTSGLICGAVLDTPVTVTDEDQLLVKYRRYYSGTFFWVDVYSTTSLSNCPANKVGTIISDGVSYAYSMHIPAIQLLGSSPSIPSGYVHSLYSYGIIRYRTTQGGSFTQLSVTPTVTLVGAHGTNMDTFTRRYVEVIPPSAGALTFARFHTMHTVTGGSPYRFGCIIDFTPPLPKPATHKFTLDITYAISWDSL